MGMKVGFIGLGSMGVPMATRLVEAGHDVRVWARRPAVAESLRQQGATVVAAPDDAFAGDVLVTMLPDDEAAMTLIADGALLRVGTGKIHVNMATLSSGCSRELANLHAVQGVHYVSAPVFGRSEVAAAGKLAILAAGDPDIVRRCQPLFDAMGRRTWYLGGDPGLANIVKIGGNFMVASAIEAIGEAMALVRAAGVPADLFADIISNALFDTPVYRAYAALIAEERFTPPGFRLELGLKDLRLALEAGDERAVPLPLASLLRDSFLEAMATGGADLDWSALGLVARRRAGLDGPFVQ